MNFTQIKMIICDMDGTLLDNQKNLPPPILIKYIRNCMIEISFLRFRLEDRWEK